MAAFGGFCIWRIARLLWPASAATQLVCVLLYAGSAQVLVTAMTAYSMSMHLALNMLWLWLFLLDRRRTHAAAMIVGWFATGIHQPVFHPLFVLPFLFLLLQQKRWKLLAAYCFAYALIGAFWLAWPMWISSHGTAAAVSINGTSGVDFATRLRTVLAGSSYNGLWIMTANLFRFICWQHVLLVPLAIVGTMGEFPPRADVPGAGDQLRPADHSHRPAIAMAGIRVGVSLRSPGAWLPDPARRLWLAQPRDAGASICARSCCARAHSRYLCLSGLCRAGAPYRRPVRATAPPIPSADADILIVDSGGAALCGRPRFQSPRYFEPTEVAAGLSAQTAGPQDRLRPGIDRIRARVPAGAGGAILQHRAGGQADPEDGRIDRPIDQFQLYR